MQAHSQDFFAGGGGFSLAGRRQVHWSSWVIEMLENLAKSHSNRPTGSCKWRQQFTYIQYTIQYK
jgi:site-specific DNA-cytosine methylase